LIYSKVYRWRPVTIANRTAPEGRVCGCRTIGWGARAHSPECS